MDKETRLLIILRTLKTIRITIEAIEKDLRLMMTPPEPTYIMPTPICPLFSMIISYDCDGINMTKEQLKEKFGSDNFDENFLSLLRSGDIYEMHDIIYPIDSKNT